MPDPPAFTLASVTPTAATALAAVFANLPFSTADQLVDVGSKLSGLDSQLSSLPDRFSEVLSVINNVQTSVSGVDSELSSFSNRLNEISTMIDNIQTSVGQLRTPLLELTETISPFADTLPNLGPSVEFWESISQPALISLESGHSLIYHINEHLPTLYPELGNASFMFRVAPGLVPYGDTIFVINFHSTESVVAKRVCAISNSSIGNLIVNDLSGAVNYSHMSLSL